MAANTCRFCSLPIRETDALCLECQEDARAEIEALHAPKTFDAGVPADETETEKPVWN